MIIAVDFDGTLVEDNYPLIGKPNKIIFKYLQQLQQQGHRLILWTCRSDKDLAAAINFCKKLGLLFDAVNTNLPEQLEKFPNNCRKVFADVYLDDKAVNIRTLEKILLKNTV